MILFCFDVICGETSVHEAPDSENHEHHRKAVGQHDTGLIIDRRRRLRIEKDSINVCIEFGTRDGVVTRSERLSKQMQGRSVGN